MPVVAEQKSNIAKKSDARSSRAGASIAKESALAKSGAPKNQVHTTGANTLFENRLVMMSSLRKNLTR
jgi:hypothetical protein